MCGPGASEPAQSRAWSPGWGLTAFVFFAQASRASRRAASPTTARPGKTITKNRVSAMAVLTTRSPATEPLACSLHCSWFPGPVWPSVRLTEETRCSHLLSPPPPFPPPSELQRACTCTGGPGTAVLVPFRAAWPGQTSHLCSLSCRHLALSGYFRAGAEKRTVGLREGSPQLEWVMRCLIFLRN